jgi:hypothetical protein
VQPQHAERLGDGVGPVTVGLVAVAARGLFAVLEQGDEVSVPEVGGGSIGDGRDQQELADRAGVDVAPCRPRVGADLRLEPVRGVLDVGSGHASGGEREDHVRRQPLVRERLGALAEVEGDLDAFAVDELCGEPASCGLRGIGRGGGCGGGRGRGERQGGGDGENRARRTSGPADQGCASRDRTRAGSGGTCHEHALRHAGAFGGRRLGRASGLRPAFLDGCLVEPLAVDRCSGSSDVRFARTTYGCGSAPDFDRLPLPDSVSVLRGN